MCAFTITSANASEIDLNKTCIENNYVADTHDMELKTFAQMSMSKMMQIQSSSLKVCDDNYDPSSVKVILNRAASISRLNVGRFLQIPNIKSVIGVDRIVTDEDMDNERFRRILTLELKVAGRSQVLEAISALEVLDEVLVAEPSYIFESGDDWAPPNDTEYNQQWGLKGVNGIKAEDAWSITNGDTDPRMTVGIFETGLQANHPDLRVLAGNFTPGVGSAAEHGTKVGGVISAKTHNNLGVAGIAQVNVALLNRNSFQASLEWARDNGIQIVNASYWQSRPTINAAGAVTEDATPNATNMAAIANFPGLYIASAGNQGLNNDTDPQYPAAYNLPNLISVGSIDENGARSSFSNFGATSVHIFAPGGSIRTTTTGSGYATVSGTSFAAPHVAGTAALMASVIQSRTTDMSQAQISALIKSTILNTVTKDTEKLGGLCVTEGRLNAYAALNQLKFASRERIFDNVGYEGSTYYWNGKVDASVDNGNAYHKNSSDQLVFTNNRTDITFTLSTVSSSNAWAAINGTITYQLTNQYGGITKINNNETFVSTVDVNLVNSVTIGTPSFKVNVGSMILDGTYTLTMTSEFKRMDWVDSRTQTFTFQVERPSSSCVAEGTLITLADGTQKAVEELTGDERLLVWNFFTGTFDTAPILFIDKEAPREYEVIDLTFSDGTSVRVIDEHGFWDFDLNEYVFLRKDAVKYVGHWFGKQTTDAEGNPISKHVQLTDVDVKTARTSAWSPVTYGRLCYYVNGMLSMPGATDGLINIFDVDPAAMKYDEEAMQADIEQYGLFTYEEFAARYSVPEAIFEAFGGRYLKVALGKGLLTEEMLEALIARYSVFFPA